MDREPNDKKEKQSVSIFGKLRNKYRSAVDAYEEKRARRDIIFTETITPAPPEKPPVLVRGGIDIQLLLIVLALLIFGAIMCFSASNVYASEEYGDSLHFFKRYILYAVMSIAVTAVLVVFVKPSHLRYAALFLYAVTVVLLLLVLVIGDTGGGAQRWIAVGPITIQPSEIAKLSLVLMLSLYMSHYEKEIKSVHVRGGSFRKGVLFPCIIIGIIIMLVMLEKHISGVIIIGLIGLSVMYMGGTHTKWMFLILGALGLAACMLILVSGYAQERVHTWLNIYDVDPTGSAWQTLQGMYAIGSGGFFGRGLGNSTQKYGYVSQPQNDFIFTIVCEELGFIGAAIVVGLFALLVYRGFKIAANCPDKYMRLVAYGLSFKVALQALLNIAVVTNSMPNTGVSLPFFSSGGTALLVQILEVGILLIISRYSAEKKS